MNPKNVKIIRGSGFKHLDGSLVTVLGEGDDGYLSVIPQGEKSVPIKIDARCIQEVNIQKVLTYEFQISKYEPNGSEHCDSKYYYINEALRDVDLEVIIDFLDKNLRPILKLE